MLSCFHLVPKRNGQTDGRSDRFAISISRVSMLTRYNKNLAIANRSRVSFAQYTLRAFVGINITL